MQLWNLFDGGDDDDQPTSEDRDPETGDYGLDDELGGSRVGEPEGDDPQDL